MQTKMLMAIFLLALLAVSSLSANAAGNPGNQLAKTGLTGSEGANKPGAGKPVTPNTTSCKEKEEPNPSCPGSQRAKIISCPGQLPESSCIR